MNFLDKLKTIGLHIPKLTNLVSLNLSINIDKSVKIDLSNATLTVNPSKLNSKQKRGLKKILREEALDAAGAIVNKRDMPIVKEALKALPSIEEDSKKLLPLIPPKDVPLLKACLFMRKKFENGECVEDLKHQIISVYGTRGGNFANLCSAGYLETWFLPLYDELLRASPDNPDAAKLKFQLQYENIVIESPWTEFVSAGMSATKVINHISEKMTRNIQNGVNYLNIHGLGKSNVKKIQNILPELKTKIGATVAQMNQEAACIFVRLEITHKT